MLMANGLKARSNLAARQHQKTSSLSWFFIGENRLVDLFFSAFSYFYRLGSALIIMRKDRYHLVTRPYTWCCGMI
jgi:hypothetical protein